MTATSFIKDQLKVWAFRLGPIEIIGPALNQTVFLIFKGVSKYIGRSEKERSLSLLLFFSSHNFSSITARDRVSVKGVESLWGDCRFIPADWGS